MSERNPHSDVVNAWRASRAGALSPQALVDLYDDALDALWRRAHMSLGDITLMAIMERVLLDGTERFPHLAALKTETSGVHCGELRQAANALEVTLLDESLAFLLCELLRVLGTLTGEVLTPGLHSELRKMQAPQPGQMGGKS